MKKTFAYKDETAWSDNLDHCHRRVLKVGGQSSSSLENVLEYAFELPVESGND